MKPCYKKRFSDSILSGFHSRWRTRSITQKQEIVNMSQLTCAVPPTVPANNSLASAARGRSDAFGESLDIIFGNGGVADG